MIVPFPAGGPADIVGRLYAQHLSAIVGQPVVTLNRDGASGSIGTAAAARAAPDGYTLVFGTTSTMVVNPLVMREVPYDFWKDFALIALIANAPHILAVREGLPAKSATELVAMAKRDPGKYTIASSGVGTIVQMAAELLKHETGADLLVVPFKGGQPATLALLSGEVDMIVNDLTGLKSNLASGTRRALDHAPRVVEPGLPAPADGRGAEVDVLPVVFARERRREKPHDVHRRMTAPGGELAAFGRRLLLGRQAFHQLADHAAHVMDLLLLRDVAVGAARVLDILLPAE